MKIALGADHAGFALKEYLKEGLVARDHEVIDLGTHGEESVDYPDYAHAVARAIVAGDADVGLLVCGTGVGQSMAANRHPGIRAAVCSDTFSARMARLHNDANVLCLGARVVGGGLAEDLVTAFLASGFEGGRHARRVAKIEPSGG
jgi:ribose 5-phosphate isomerase B